MLLLNDILHFLNSIAIGAGFTIFIGLVSLAGYWLSHLERVPISGRFKFVWYDQNFPKEFGHIRACRVRQYLAAMHIEVLGVDEPVTQAVQSIINRLSRPQAANGHSFNLCLLVHPGRSSVERHFPACTEPIVEEIAESICGGTIFMSTEQLLRFQTPGQLAGVLAHEMAHIIAGLELSPRNAVTMLASPPIGEQLGRIETITENLSERRVLEAEADYIGLFLMAEAGFDPHERLTIFDRETCRQSSLITSQPIQPLLETFSTHPSVYYPAIMLF